MHFLELKQRVTARLLSSSMMSRVGWVGTKKTAAVTNAGRLVRNSVESRKNGGRNSAPTPEPVYRYYSLGRHTAAVPTCLQLLRVRLGVA